MAEPPDRPPGSRLSPPATRPAVDRGPSALSIGDFTDSDGRPLDQRGARDTRGLAFDMRPCPYDDARRGLPMNVDAMRQIRARWDDIMAAIAILESDYRQLFGVGTDPVARLRRLTRVLGSLPEFLALYLGTRDGEVPVLAATLYKLSRGMSPLAEKLVFEPSADGDTVDPTPDALYAFAERHRLLVGSDEVCAGPQAMIVETLTAMLGDSAQTEAPALEAMLDPSARIAAVRYGAGLADFLLVRHYISAAFALLDGVPAGNAAAWQGARRRIVALHHRDFTRQRDLVPGDLDRVMETARYCLISAIAASAAMALIRQ